MSNFSPNIDYNGNRSIKLEKSVADSILGEYEIKKKVLEQEKTEKLD